LTIRIAGRSTGPHTILVQTAPGSPGSQIGSEHVAGWSLNSGIDPTMAFNALVRMDAIMKSEMKRAAVLIYFKREGGGRLAS
jgi:hypothetical protein